MDLCIARQPIFTKTLDLFAYRLEFRSGFDQALPALDPTVASAQLIAETVAHLGLHELTGGTRAVIPVSRTLLVGHYAAMLPRDHTVVEVGDEVPADQAAVSVCAELHRAGHRLAIPVSRRDPSRLLPRLPWADILIVDARTSPLPDPARIRSTTGTPITVLAAHVETQAMFQAAVAAGYDVFRGPFFTQPGPVRASNLPAWRLRYLTLLEAVLAPDSNILRVADIITRDVTLAYRLLRYVNSAYFGLPRTIRSIMDALLLLGERDVQRWACLMNLAALGDHAPAAIVVECAVRGRMCELIAQHCREAVSGGDAFLVGLFSLLDVLLDRPLAAVLADFPLPTAVKDALLGVRNPLREVLDCVLAYMRADWEQFATQIAGLGPVPTEVPQRYREAIAWAQDILPATDRVN